MKVLNISSAESEDRFLIVVDKITSVELKIRTNGSICINIDLGVNIHAIECETIESARLRYDEITELILKKE